MTGNRIVALSLGLLVALWAAYGAAQSPDAPQPAPQTPEVTVYVGTSAVVNAPWPAKRVAITDPKVADVQVLTAKQILLQGKKPGKTDLIMWNAEEQVWRCKVDVKVDISAIRAELRQLFPDTTIAIRESGDTTVVSGSLGRTDQVDQLRRFLDARQLKYVDMTDLAGVQQVMLKVRVAEVSRSALRALGINAVHTGNDFFGGSTVGSSGGGPINPISIGTPAGTTPGHGLPFAFTDDVAVSPSVTLFGGFQKFDVELFLQALAENQYLRVLAEPNLTALSGKDADFLAGGEYPIPIVQGTTGGGTSISVEYREFGVRLKFRPTVLGDGSIRLFVAPEVSELTDAGAVTQNGFQIPGLITRRASTTVEMKSEQTFAIAGLISQTSKARVSRVPGLGDIPVLGALFRSVRYTSGDTELVVLVTASLVSPSSEVGLPPSPGMLHVVPNDWEVYALGRIEGSVMPKLSPLEIEALKEMGLDKLKGPGAWARYEQRPAASQAKIAAEPSQ